jgi:ketosteroid isomerase-like protein
LIVAGCGRAPVPPLRETAAALQQALTARDPNRIASFFAEDAIAMYPLPQPIIGREANRHAWESYYSRRSAHPVTVDSVVVSAAGDLGYTFGRYLTAEARDPSATGGRYVIVWRKIDDQWRIAILSAHEYPDITSATFAPR